EQARQARGVAAGRRPRRDAARATAAARREQALIRVVAVALGAAVADAGRRLARLGLRQTFAAHVPLIRRAVHVPARVALAHAARHLAREALGAGDVGTRVLDALAVVRVA